MRTITAITGGLMPVLDAVAAQLRLHMGDVVEQIATPGTAACRPVAVLVGPVPGHDIIDALPLVCVGAVGLAATDHENAGRTHEWQATYLVSVDVVDIIGDGAPGSSQWGMLHAYELAVRAIVHAAPSFDTATKCFRADTATITSRFTDGAEVPGSNSLYRLAQCQVSFEVTAREGITFAPLVDASPANPVDLDLTITTLAIGQEAP
jgi:hypothetical protein